MYGLIQPGSTMILSIMTGVHKIGNMASFSLQTVLLDSAENVARNCT
jgi:hypothetical protein